MKNLIPRKEDKLILCCATTNVDPETEAKIVSMVCEDLDW